MQKPEQPKKDYQKARSWREACDYCEGNIRLVEKKNYIVAECPKCKSEHRWGDEDACWFGV